ncbi:DNA adenine methylase [Riemerella columbipharyngis]|uniref:site-specific DNA-methyltransferase (adenine-specific) n=1 Tax=Riemerella columbipharyngis TaxID=1071918 RepID=A0A1G7BJR9_9FLAO|nr:DNA adenine methylase [Riemerella columbipharyngis]SDE27233.1 DNA adenine methylase [Riemerella columbipharyngis]
MHSGRNIKPFLKWAGGKTQLISEIKNVIPDIFYKEEFTYIEPFVGSGAVLFSILNHFPNAKNIVINDINEDLINTYKTIKENPNDLITLLEDFQKEYHLLEGEEKKAYYYEKRFRFNSRLRDIIEQSALFIFLNRTCFNGLYRVNKRNEFNVPMGSYKRPLICDTNNILAVSKALKNIEILCGDYQQTLKYAQGNTLFYFDPPYKPLSETSSFNAYTKYDFNDDEQIRLAHFCQKIDDLGFSWILSNSDVKGKNPENNFFDDLYREFDINRVLAKRSINANPQKRGQLTELLIMNIPKF